jgi:hypothetical protein
LYRQGTSFGYREEAVPTFYYYVCEAHGFQEKELPQRPIETVQYLRNMLGEVAFQSLERPIVTQIRETFEIDEDVDDLPMAFELAKRNFLRASL